MAAQGFALSITSATYTTDPDVTCDFEPNEFFLQLSTASVLLFSFDGTNNHGRIDSTVAKTIQWRTRAKKVWFKYVSGTTPALGFLSFFTNA